MPVKGGKVTRRRRQTSSLTHLPVSARKHTAKYYKDRLSLKMAHLVLQPTGKQAPRNRNMLRSEPRPRRVEPAANNTTWKPWRNAHQQWVQRGFRDTLKNAACNMTTTCTKYNMYGAVGSQAQTDQRYNAMIIFAARDRGASSGEQTDGEAAARR